MEIWGHKGNVDRGIIPQGVLTHLILPFPWLGSCFMSWAYFLLCVLCVCVWGEGQPRSR